MVEHPGSGHQPCNRILNGLQLLQQVVADAVQQAVAIAETNACTSVFADSSVKR